MIILVLSLKILEFLILNLSTQILVFLDTYYVILFIKMQRLYIDLCDFPKMRCYIVTSRLSAAFKRDEWNLPADNTCFVIFVIKKEFHSWYRDPDNSAPAMVEPTIRYCGLSSCPCREKASNAKLIMMQE